MFKKLLVGIIGIATLSLSACNKQLTMGVYADADKYLIGSQSYEGEVTDLTINWICGEINLIEDATINGVKIEEINELHDKEKVHSYFHDKTVYVRFMESGLRANIKPEDKKLTVVYHPGLENLCINLSSGMVNASKLTSKNITVHYTSGSCAIEEATCENMDIVFTSGTLEMSSLDAKNYSCAFSSGNAMTRFHSLEKADFRFNSGKAIISTPEKGATVSITKTSGTIEVKPEHTKQDDKYVIGDGSAIIDIDFTSGSAYIY